MECDYLNGWIKKRSHTQKSHPKMVNPRDIAGECRRRRISFTEINMPSTLALIVNIIIQSSLLILLSLYAFNLTPTLSICFNFICHWVMWLILVSVSFGKQVLQSVTCGYVSDWCWFFRVMDPPLRLHYRSFSDCSMKCVSLQRRSAKSRSVKYSTHTKRVWVFFYF